MAKEKGQDMSKVMGTIPLAGMQMVIRLGKVKEVGDGGEAGMETGDTGRVVGEQETGMGLGLTMVGTEEEEETDSGAW